eukprot:139036-Amphidinium_carterae.1
MTPVDTKEETEMRARGEALMAEASNLRKMLKQETVHPPHRNLMEMMMETIQRMMIARSFHRCQSTHREMKEG